MAPKSRPPDSELRQTVQLLRNGKWLYRWAAVDNRQVRSSDWFVYIIDDGGEAELVDLMANVGLGFVFRGVEGASTEADKVRSSWKEARRRAREGQANRLWEVEPEGA